MKPSIQSIIDRQHMAQDRLYHDKTTRSPPEVASYQRMLNPVPLVDLILPQLPMARVIGSSSSGTVLLGEVAQKPGTALLFDLDTGSISVAAVDQLELVPPG